MKNLDRISLMVALSLSLASLWQPTQAQDAASPSPEAQAVVEIAAKPDTPQQALPQSLIDATKAFHDNANDTTWNAFFGEFKSFLETTSGRQTLLALNYGTSPFADLHVKIIDAGNAHIWNFPEISQSQKLLIEWRETKTQQTVIKTHGKKSAHHKTVTQTIVTSKIQTLALPAGAQVTDAKVLDLLTKDKASGQAGTGRYLVLAGSTRPEHNIWVDSFKMTGSGWTEDRSPLAEIPPQFLNSVYGSAYFSGSDLVFNVIPTNPDATAANKTLASPLAPESSTYRLGLRFQEGRYEMEGGKADDSAVGALTQFLAALKQGRTELAKVWLTDDRLVSIPKYLGLFAKGAAAPYRILSMNCPHPGDYRFRLVTFDKNDLIIDVGHAHLQPQDKVKTAWVIKSIFIAPANSFLQKIAQLLPPINFSLAHNDPQIGQSNHFDADQAEIAVKHTVPTSQANNAGLKANASKAIR